MNLNISEVISLIKEAAKRSKGYSKQADHSVRAELVADNLIANNVFPAESRPAIVESLKDHGKTLLLLDKVASSLTPESLGTPLKRETRGSVSGYSYNTVRDSDRAFVEAAYRASR